MSLYTSFQDHLGQSAMDGAALGEREALQARYKSTALFIYKPEVITGNNLPVKLRKRQSQKGVTV